MRPRSAPRWSTLFSSTKSICSPNSDAAQTPAANITLSAGSPDVAYATYIQADSGFRGSAQFVNDARAERELFLQEVIETCTANAALLNESGKVVYVSKSLQQAAGAGAFGAIPDPLAFNHLESKKKATVGIPGKGATLAEDIQKLIAGERDEFQAEYSCDQGGSRGFFVARATPLNLSEPCLPFRVLVTIEDVTSNKEAEKALRELGGRLIKAQEEERSRVARELHDDLTQRMALVSIELEQLARRIPAEQENVRAAIRNIWTRAQEVSSEIHRVSYQLHPSKLDHLGLAAAVNSLCEELANRHEIKIEFRHKRRKAKLPAEVTLCLFRIVQESLRNVIRHSGSPEAKVVLGGTSQVVHLIVSDQGRGFDVKSTETRRGLGLISMNERLRSVGGEMSINSTPHGTSIEVSVPLFEQAVSNLRSQI